MTKNACGPVDQNPMITKFNNKLYDKNPMIN